MKNLLLGFMTSFLMTSAFAQAIGPETVVVLPTDVVIDRAEPAPTRLFLPDTYKIKPGDTKIISLGRYTYIDRVSLEAKLCLFCGKESFRISFDGFSQGPVQAEGGLMGYRTKIVSADVGTRTIEITNTSRCELKIRSIEVLPRRWAAGRTGHDNYGHGQPGSHRRGPVFSHVSEPAAQVSFLVESYMMLDQLVGDQDRMDFVSPGKKIVGRAEAILNSTPETSQASVKAIQSVLKELERARSFFDRLAGSEANFELIQEIQSVEASLERMVR